MAAGSMIRGPFAGLGMHNRGARQLAAVWVLLAAVLLGGSACSRQESAWRSARSADSAVAYDEYLQAYPAGSHAAEASARLNELRERQEWDRARRLGTPEAFQRYLAGYPEGRFAQAAHDRLADFVLAQAPAGTDPGPASGLRGPIAAGSWIQLGAFAAGEAAARQAWVALSERHADLLGGLTPDLRPREHGSRTLWHLMAGPLDQARARQLCEALRARGEACLPVRH